MTDGELAYLTPEAKARIEIDRMLAAAGWVVQDARAANLAAAQGVAVREFVMKAPHGRADYLLFLDGAAAGVIEAKKEGETLRGVQWQSAKYVDGVPDEVPTAIDGALPFVYESTGIETHFTNTLDPDAASREVFSFHQPGTLVGWLADISKHPTSPTLRHRLRGLPELTPEGLWDAQFTAIRNLESSLAANRPRALIQMATGSGKTFTAANIAYRLVKHADARRILFLVDRANLGRQTLKEFQGFSTPDDGRKFTELYNVQHLSSNRVDPVARVTISTIQRVYSILRGDSALEEELDEHSAFEVAGELVPVEYNPALPPRASTSSSSTSATARSTASGGRCSTTSTPSRSGSPRRRTSRRSASSTRTSSWSTATSRRSWTASTSTSTSTASAPRSPSTARRSTPACGRSFAIARHAARAGSSSTTSSRTRRPSSTARSSRATRSAPCSRPSATASSPRSSPAARTCPRR